MTTSYQRAETFFAKDMKEPLKQILQARSLFRSQVPITTGKTKYNYDTVSSMQDAIITLGDEIVDGPWEGITVQDADIDLARITQKWIIPRSQFDAYATDGKNLSVVAERAATQALGVSEEGLLINTWKPNGSTGKVNGLIGAAGSSYSTSAPFSTFGNAIKAVAGMFTEISTAKVPVAGLNWNLGLSPENFYELAGSQSNGILEMPQVERMLNRVQGAPGKVYESPEISAGTAVLSPVDNAGTYMQLVIAKNPTVSLGYDSKDPDNSPIYATMYEILAPVIYQPKAICVATAI